MLWQLPPMVSLVLRCQPAVLRGSLNDESSSFSCPRSVPRVCGGTAPLNTQDWVFNLDPRACGGPGFRASLQKSAVSPSAASSSVLPGQSAPVMSQNLHSAAPVTRAPGELSRSDGESIMLTHAL